MINLSPPLDPALCILDTAMKIDVTYTNGEVSRIRDYLEETNVQLGATYNVAKQSTESCDKGLQAAAAFMNAHPDEIGTDSHLVGSRRLAPS